MSDLPVPEVRVRPELGLATDVLANTDRPLVHIQVSGAVGSGKTAILAMIYALLASKGIKVALENDYTLAELRLEEGQDHDQSLKMYSPAVILEERLVPKGAF